MHDLKQALFAAHFTDRRNLSDDVVLADVSTEIGLDRAEAFAVLADQRFAEDARAAENYSIRQRIQGVPAKVFEGRYLVNAAQGVENDANILDRLAKMPA